MADPTAEPVCPFCWSDLVLAVEGWHALSGPGALSQGWQVECQEGRHVVLTSWEWLELARLAAHQAEELGGDPEAAEASYWQGDEWAGDDHQPHPDYQLLLKVLRARGCPDPEGRP